MKLTPRREAALKIIYAAVCALLFAGALWAVVVIVFGHVVPHMLEHRK